MNPDSSSALPMLAVSAAPRVRRSSSDEPLRRLAACLCAFAARLAPSAAPLLEVARAASAIFLCGSWRAGALLCAALLFLPHYFAFAVVACLLGGVIAKALHFPAAMRQDGTLLYNVLLSALAVAWLTRGSVLTTPAVWGMLGIVTVYTLLLSAALWHWFPLRAGLPPLSVAFVVAFGTLLTFFPHWAAAAALLDPGLPAEPVLPFVVTAFLRSMGTILFLPNVWTGLAVTGAILVWSRVAMINALAGYAGGILIVKLLEACGLQWLGWFAGHNYLLAGMALGAVYFVPSWGSLTLAFVAGAIAALHAAAVQHFLRGSGWEYLPLPYLLTIWGMLCAMRLREKTGALLPAREAYDSPEAAAAALAIANARFPHRHATHVLLPTAREVTVTQGFDGQLSHRGSWRHALDFEVHDTAGRPCPPGCDNDLANYYTQRLEVRAPGSGEVLRVIDGVHDNAPGGCNFAQNWGNHLILRLDYGGIIKLAHFMQNGILVKAGQRVTAGDLLGYCGNSGRSPVPHIHLHAQTGADTGAPTAPFCLTNFFTRTEAGPRWSFADVPHVGDRIAPATPAPAVLDMLAHFSPGTATYRITTTGHAAPDRFQESVGLTLDDAGRYVFQGRHGSRLTAVLGLHAMQITANHSHDSLFLRLLSLAMPTLPFACQSGMFWEDHVALSEVRSPAGLLARCGRALAGVFSAYLPAANVRVILRHAAPPTAQRLRLVTAVQTVRGDLPARVEIETTHGLTSIAALTAHFDDHTLRFTQTTFEPGLCHAD